MPYLGAGLGVIGFALSIVGVWTEIDQDVYGKSVGTVFVASAAFTAASLLALAYLSGRHRWVMVTTLSLIATGAALLGLLPWLGDDAPDTYVRVLGVVLIALAADASACSTHDNRRYVKLGWMRPFRASPLAR